MGFAAAARSAAVLLAVCALRAAAATEDGIVADLERLMPLSLEELMALPVVTASRQQETRDETPAHIVVITREQIRERRYRNLADLLEDLPGVDFFRGTKSSAYNNFAVQGFAGPNKLLVMLDGVRVDSPAGGSYPLAENFNLYPARQVEVLYGPAAALYGADAVAGVVNIITDPAGPGAWASVGSGSFGSREAAFQAGARSNDLAITVGGHWQRSARAALDHDYPDAFPRRDATTFDGTVMVPAADREDYTGGIRSHSLHARLDLGNAVSLSYYRNAFRSLTSTGDRPETAVYQEDAPWITVTDTVFGKYRFDLSDRLSGELVADFSRQQVDPASKYLNIYTGFQDGYEYTRGERLGLEQNLHWRLDDRQRMQIGFGYQRSYAVEAHTLPSPYDTGQGPDGQGLYYRNTDLPLRILDARYENLSAYAQLQSRWTPDLTTMAGLRLDRHSAYGHSLNPRLGAVWRLDRQHLFKVLYGEAFRAPSPDESLSSFGAFDGSVDAQGRYRGTGFRVPNQDLEPERSRTLSLVWDWRPRADLNFVANAYRSHIRNLVVTLPSTDVNAIPGAILIAPESKGNAGRQVQTGIDLAGQWRFRLDSAWSGEVWGSASHIRGRIDEGDGIDWDLPHAASRKLKLGATWRWHDRWTLSTQLLHVGDTANGRKRDRSAPPDRLMTPGYTVVNLHLGWHRLLDGRVSLWLDVHNLFDRRYYAAHGAGSRTFFDMPQQPRTWLASLDYRF